MRPTVDCCQCDAYRSISSVAVTIDLRFYTQSAAIHRCLLQDSNLTIILTKNYLKVQVPEQNEYFSVHKYTYTYTVSLGPFNFINTTPSPVCNTYRKIYVLYVKFGRVNKKGKKRIKYVLLARVFDARIEKFIFWC